MTKSTITRERIQRIIRAINSEAYDEEEIREWLSSDEIMELSRMALAAMDSEPVKRVNADQMHHVCLEANRHLDKYGAMAKEVNKLLGRIPAQPAPVVPDDVLDALQKVARISLDLNDFDGDRRGIADCLGDAEEALIEVVNRRAAMLHAGNSPAQSDCCPAQNHVSPEQNSVAPAQSGNSQAIPDGYVLVPKEATKEILDEFDSIIDYGAEDSVDAWHRLLAAAPQELKP